MRLLALDISTNTGFAFFIDGVRHSSGTLWPEARWQQFPDPYPFNYVRQTEKIAAKISELTFVLNPDEIVIEETTASSSNFSQKQLEYLHFAVLKDIEHLSNTIVKAFDRPPIKVSYVRDGVWKRMTGANQTKEERNYNAKVARIKKKTGKKLAKIDGKVAGKLTKKHYYIRAANAHFQEVVGRELKLKDENEAAALLLGLAYMKGAPICDGTEYGGLLPKVEV